MLTTVRFKKAKWEFKKTNNCVIFNLITVIILHTDACVDFSAFILSVVWISTQRSIWSVKTLLILHSKCHF